MDPEWTVFVRDGSLQIQGQLDDYQSLELVQRRNGIGAFTLTIHRSNRHAANLTSPQWGIVVRCDDQIIFSGVVTGRKHVFDGRAERIQLTGVDDNRWLMSRLVSPQPSTSAPPYSVTDYDVRTGAASTVLLGFVDANLGATAVGARKKSYLVTASDPGIGATVTGRGRWQKLLPLLQEVASAGGDDICFRVVQGESAGAPALVFEVFRAADKSEQVKFSTELGNLAAYEYESVAPDANYVFVGGQGEGTAREIRERSDTSAVATWERLEGDFVDRRDTSDDTELDQAGDEALTGAQEKTSMSITPIDTPTLRYGRDYGLGDKVSLEWEDGTVVDVIQEVKINLTAQGPQKIQPSIGNVSGTDISRFFRTFAEMRADIVNLQRR